MTYSYFPDSQTLTMQQEALKRVRDMQLRARQSVEQSNVFSDPYIQQAAPPQQSGPAVQPQPQFQAQPPYQPAVPPQFQQSIPQQPSFQRPPQQNTSQGYMQQGQQQNIPQQNNTQQGQQRQSGFSQPNNILSHLFGGGRQSGQQNLGNGLFGGGQRGFSQSGNQNTPRPGGSGLLDLLRKQGLGDSVSGLGETLQNTISSVSEPISGLLESFGIDGEKLVILLVMWAIFNEHKDNKMLLMALGYLLL